MGELLALALIGTLLLAMTYVLSILATIVFYACAIVLAPIYLLTRWMLRLLGSASSRDGSRK